VSVTADQLREAEAAFRAASLATEAALEQRTALLHRALDEGWTHAQIAEATGLSRGRVGQIASAGRNGR
jgi:DNA-directed RNA polymerase specialized sigma24 family protein